MWPFFFLSWLLPWFVFRYKPTYLLAQCPVLGGLAAAFCSRVFRIPLFVELHGAHYFAPARPGWKGEVEHVLYRWLSRITFWAATRIRSLSDDMSECVLQVCGAATYKKVIVIPNRVDLEIFRFSKSTYATDGCFRVITVGSFFPRKNLYALIEDLCKTGVDFRLTLVGAGPLKEEYLTLADRLHMRDRIEMVSLDHQSLAALLPQQDVYVHYALSEGVPRAILEAMAAGLPVVATRVGFIKGVLCDEENALVIDQPYTDGLVKSLRSLAESEDLRRRLGVAARHTIEERFEWNRVFDQYRSAIKAMSLEER
ncbi:MAG: hypothetical protein A2143_09095 [Gallionellales bacterium RBG_16_57_15]|nr:MAG: hypothetical protein A2143_09095 [Gallionellales bacterium RBG_16_57_15]